MNKKFPLVTSVRLTHDGEKMCRIIMDKLGMNRTRVIELAVRRLADIEGITKSDVENYVLTEEE